MERKQIATSHDGKYTYWLGADRYIYQRIGTNGDWLGWLCAESAWESTFSVAAEFGPYTDPSACTDKQVTLQARGWRVQPATPDKDKRLNFRAYAPDAQKLQSERCKPQFVLA